MIPYGRQIIDQSDIDSVVGVLNSDFLTTGPRVKEFESIIAKITEAPFCAAVSSGTAALHCAVNAIGIDPGDEVIVPPITFAATAAAVVYEGGVPVFADVDEDTLLIDPNCVEKKITKNTKAIIGVDYAGQPCKWDELRVLADDNKLSLIADGCHALGARYKNEPVGKLADLTVFSFHPVKHITTAEGGAVVTENKSLCEKIKKFRNHGISTDYKNREKENTWEYAVESLGYNYRLSDLQSALGINQAKKLQKFIKVRQEMARFYNDIFSGFDKIIPLKLRDEVYHAFHLYVVKIVCNGDIDRKKVFEVMREKGIGVNVHYIPVHLHPFYMRKFGYGKGLCPIAEKKYEEILTLPLWPGLTREKLQFIADTLISTVYE